MKFGRILTTIAIPACLFLSSGGLPEICSQEAGVSSDAASRVEIRRTSGKPALIVNGRAFVVRGAGGDGPQELLAECGGNSIRTWGVDGRTQAILDEAHKLGLMVTLGIWLGHERHGFSYSSYRNVVEQADAVRTAVKKFKDHPAVLMWALGNEMEGYEAGDNPAIWSHIQALAAEVKQLDPHHPTMTVVAEIGGKRVEAIHRLCPDIDVVGINSYGGVASIPKRYREAGGSKPYVVTEFGPPGIWEIPKNSFGAPEELSSTAKAEIYRSSWRSLMADDLCLGAYAFTWGFKQEATATWFGMLLPGGARLEAVDALAEEWKGSPLPNRCPRISSLKVAAQESLKPGDTLQALLKMSDPEGDELKVHWKLVDDPMNYGTGGDSEGSPDEFPELLSGATNSSVTVTMPEFGGVYRIFAYVYDSHGGAAVANVPVFVDGPKRKIKPAPTVSLPLFVAGEVVDKFPFQPSGWMGNHENIAMDDRWATAPHSGETCLKVEYARPDGWGGVVWQNPPGDWGDRAGGYDLSNAKKLSFWARGERGGERVRFGVGLIGDDKPYRDSTKTDIELALTQNWKQYELKLSDRDLSRIKSGFFWTLAAQGDKVVFYLDDVQFE